MLHKRLIIYNKDLQKKNVFSTKGINLKKYDNKNCQ